MQGEAIREDSVRVSKMELPDGCALPSMCTGGKKILSFECAKTVLGQWAMAKGPSHF